MTVTQQAPDQRTVAHQALIDLRRQLEAAAIATREATNLPTLRRRERRQLRAAEVAAWAARDRLLPALSVVARNNPRFAPAR